MTGGAGFGGSHLCERLLSLGAEVVVLDRGIPRTSYLALSGNDRRVTFVAGDVRDVDLVATTLERFEVDVVFHLAAQPLVPTSNVLPLETLTTNALGTYAMLEASRRSRFGKRFVFASSGAYYGTRTDDEPIAEDSAPRLAANVYAPSKVAGDVAVRCYARTYGLATAVCRFMNTYGPGDTNFSRIVPKAASLLLEDAEYDLGDRDDGSTRLDFLSIDDMTEAYVAVASRIDEVAGEAFNFGSGQATSTRDVALAASLAFDGRRREPRFRGEPRSRPLIKYLDIAKARDVLGWRPRTSLEDGLRRTMEWFREYRERIGLSRWRRS